MSITTNRAQQNKQLLPVKTMRNLLKTKVKGETRERGEKEKGMITLQLASSGLQFSRGARVKHFPSSFEFDVVRRFPRIPWLSNFRAYLLLAFFAQFVAPFGLKTNSGE